MQAYNQRLSASTRVFVLPVNLYTTDHDTHYETVTMGDQSMRDYGLAAPHGPNMGGEHVATADLGDMSGNEAGVFNQLLKPDDSYDETGTYWADMGIFRRLKFTSKVDAAEAKKELASIGRMMKADPLSPISFYMRNMVIPGAGLFLEGCVRSVMSHTCNSLLTPTQIRALLDW